MLRGKKRYFQDDDEDNDKFESEAFKHMNDEDSDQDDDASDDEKELEQEEDEDDILHDTANSSDDEAPDDVGFHESRQSVLSQLKSALKQVDVEKQRKKEKRKMIDEHFKQQKLKKKEELATAQLPDDILDGIDDVIPKKIQKKEQQKPNQTVKKEKKKKQKSNKSGNQKSIRSSEDYIAFTDKSSGVIVADVKYVENQCKTAGQLAAEFKQNRLYGSHIKRVSNKDRLAVKEKRRHNKS
ncbi:hypothetical protein ACF0H5_019564 [Mactra antiquata]